MQLRLGFFSANESHGADGKRDGKTAFFLARNMIQSITHRNSSKEILSKRTNICRTRITSNEMQTLYWKGSGTSEKSFSAFLC